MQQTTQHFMYKHCTATSKHQVYNSYQELQEEWNLNLYFITQIWGGNCWLISPTPSWLPLPPSCPCNHCHRRHHHHHHHYSCQHYAPKGLQQILKNRVLQQFELSSHTSSRLILGINTAIITINTSRNEDSLQNFLALTQSWHAEDCNQAYTSWGQQISCLYLATLSILGEEKKQYS